MATLLLMGDPTSPHPINMRSQLWGQMYSGSYKHHQGITEVLRWPQLSVTAACLLLSPLWSLICPGSSPLRLWKLLGAAHPHSKQSTSIKVWFQISSFEKLKKELAGLRPQWSRAPTRPSPSIIFFCRLSIPCILYHCFCALAAN